MKKDERIKEKPNKEANPNIVVQKISAEKKESEALSIKDFQEKYFGDFLKKDDNKYNNKKLLFCCK